MSNCRCGMINDSPLFWHVVNISHSFALLSPSPLFGSVVKLTCRSFFLLAVPLHRSRWSRFIHALSSSHRRRHIGWWVMKISFSFFWVYASSSRMWNVRKSISLQISFLPESENLKITYLFSECPHSLERDWWLNGSCRIPSHGILQNLKKKAERRINYGWHFSQSADSESSSRISRLITISTSCCQRSWGCYFFQSQHTKNLKSEASVNDAFLSLCKLANADARLMTSSGMSDKCDNQTSLSSVLARSNWIAINKPLHPSHCWPDTTTHHHQTTLFHHANLAYLFARSRRCRRWLVHE